MLVNLEDLAVKLIDLLLDCFIQLFLLFHELFEGLNLVFQLLLHVEFHVVFFFVLFQGVFLSGALLFLGGALLLPIFILVRRSYTPLFFFTLSLSSYLEETKVNLKA